MQELFWVVGLLALLVGAALVNLVPGMYLVQLGEGLMLGAAALGLPLEAVYFGLLWWALGQVGRPRGWYWRSFDHHALLTAQQRRWVMPWFYLGALCFLAVVIGMATLLLGAVVTVRQL